MYSPKFSMGVRRLMKEYKELTLNPPDGIIAAPIDEGNFFKWEAYFAGPGGTPFEGGFFRATLDFPPDYALSPPTMTFTPPIFHPNVFPDGKVCISILHPAGRDPLQYESVSERWSPAQSIEKVLLSVVSMLSEPNTESPANIQAALLYRNNRNEWIRVVREETSKSLDEEN